MKLITESEELELVKLRERMLTQYRIGDHLVGIKYQVVRPKYALLDTFDIMELLREMENNPDRLKKWLIGNLYPSLKRCSD